LFVIEIILCEYVFVKRAWFFYGLITVAAVCGLIMATYLSGAGVFLAGRLFKIDSLKISDDQTKALGEYISRKKNEGADAFNLKDFEVIRIGDKEFKIVEMFWDVWSSRWRRNPRELGTAWYFGSALRSYSGNRVMLIDTNRLELTDGILGGKKIEFVYDDEAKNRPEGMTSLAVKVVGKQDVDYEGYLKIVENLDLTKVVIVNVDMAKQSSQGVYEIFYVDSI
jgi:hypothetical protein